MHLLSNCPNPTFRVEVGDKELGHAGLCTLQTQLSPGNVLQALQGQGMSSHWAYVTEGKAPFPDRPFS